MCEVGSNNWFMPKHGEKFYYIKSNYHSGSTHWANTLMDRARLARGNVFRTSDECYEADKRLVREVQRTRSYSNNLTPA